MQKAIVAAVLLLAGAAQAQTVTSCDRTITGMDCTTGPSGAQQLVNGLAAMRANGERRAEKDRALALIRQDVAAGDCSAATALVAQYGNADDVRVVTQICIPAVDPAQTRKTEVARLVAGGSCADAKRVALAGGDMDLAEQAMRLCTPKVSGPPPQ